MGYRTRGSVAESVQCDREDRWKEKKVQGSLGLAIMAVDEDFIITQTTSPRANDKSIRFDVSL